MGSDGAAHCCCMVGYSHPPCPAWRLLKGNFILSAFLQKPPVDLPKMTTGCTFFGGVLRFLRFKGENQKEKTAILARFLSGLAKQSPTCLFATQMVSQAV